MKIYVACGGTGGHILPGLATARELKSRGHEVSLWLAGCSVEESSVSGWDGDVIELPAVRLHKSPLMLWRLLRVIGAARRIIKEGAPDVILAMGSYTSIGPVVAARLCGVPVVLHEANAVPGRAIARLAGFATAIGITFPQAADYLPREKTRLTGLPLRGELRQLERETHDGFSLLAMGGSQGAHAINAVVPASVKILRESGVELRVIHLAGIREATEVEKAYQDADISAEVHAFTSDMAAIYSRADFAVARSGAATCTELAACRLPALLVPYPHAVRNHQMRNAMAMARDGAYVVQLEAGFSADWLVSCLKKIIEDPARLEEMRKRAAKLEIGNRNGTRLLADLVEECCQ